MLIKKKKISDLKCAEYNPRKALKQGDAEYEMLKKGISKFGIVEPIVFNQKTGNIVGGHQRFQVLKDLGITETDCVIVDLDLEDEKKLNIALNKISGKWEVEKLQEILVELSELESDFELTGFTTNEFNALFDNMAKDIKEPEPEDDGLKDNEVLVTCPCCSKQFIVEL